MVVRSVCCATMVAPSGGDCRLVVPATGALTTVYSRLSSAARIWACAGVLELLLGRNLAPHQLLDPRVVVAGLLQRGLGLGELRLGLVERRLVGARVDAEQHLALLDAPAVGKLALEHDAADLGPHL